jgi:hypothetical protein
LPFVLNRNILIAMTTEWCKANITIKTEGFGTREGAMIDGATMTAKLGSQFAGETYETDQHKFGWTATFSCQGYCDAGKSRGICLRDRVEQLKGQGELPENASITGECANKQSP